MAKKLYDVTDLETGETKKGLTTKECQQIIGGNVVISKYCMDGKTYKKRWKFDFSKMEIPTDSTLDIMNHFDLKLYNEWISVCAMFKNVEWVTSGGKSLILKSKQREGMKNSE